MYNSMQGQSPMMAGNYDYAASMAPQNFHAQTPMAGMGQIAAALINGYGQQPQQQSQPMQLSGGQSNGSFLNNLFSGQAPMGQGQQLDPSVMPDATTSQGIY